MKKIFIIIVFLFSILSCKSQVISLEQAIMYKQQGGSIPQNTTYIKDVNHSLDKYTGSWKGTLNGKTYEFNFIKKENVGGYDVNWDFLIGRLKVNDSNGNVIYNSFNEIDDSKTKLQGYNFQPNLETYMIYFVGNNSNCAEYGFVHLRMISSVPNQMSVFLDPDNDITVEGSCQPSFVPTIPYKTTIHLTKQ